MTIGYHGPVPKRYAFLRNVGRCRTVQQLSGTYDLAIVMDGDRTRLGEVSSYFESAGQKVLFDHHRSSDASGYDLAVLDPDAASTCELVHQLMASPAFGCSLTPQIAEALYTGIVYDTGSFRFSNTSGSTLRIAADLLGQGIDHQNINEAVFLCSSYEAKVFRGKAVASSARSADGRVVWAEISRAFMGACGVGPEDTEGIVNQLVFSNGAEVAAVLIERGRQSVKISLRSRGRVNVSELAVALSPGGGGHARAAGATLAASLKDARQTVVATLEEAVARLD